MKKINFNEVIKEITEIVDGPISGEVVSEDAEGMIKEGREIAAIHKNMIVKIPMSAVFPVWVLSCRILCRCLCQRLP